MNTSKGHRASIRGSSAVLSRLIRKNKQHSPAEYIGDNSETTFDTHRRRGGEEMKTKNSSGFSSSFAHKKTGHSDDTIPFTKGESNIKSDCWYIDDTSPFTNGESNIIPVIEEEESAICFSSLSSSTIKTDCWYIDDSDIGEDAGTIPVIEEDDGSETIYSSSLPLVETDTNNNNLKKMPWSWFRKKGKKKNRNKNKQVTTDNDLQKQRRKKRKKNKKATTDNGLHKQQRTTAAALMNTPITNSNLSSEKNKTSVFKRKKKNRNKIKKATTDNGLHKQQRTTAATLVNSPITNNNLSSEKNKLSVFKRKKKNRNKNKRATTDNGLHKQQRATAATLVNTPITNNNLSSEKNKISVFKKPFVPQQQKFPKLSAPNSKPSLHRHNLAKSSFCSGESDNHLTQVKLTATEEETSVDEGEAREKTKAVRWPDLSSNGKITLTKEHSYELWYDRARRLGILLLHPKKRKFEYICCEFDASQKLLVGCILQQLPGLATKSTFQRRSYKSLCWEQEELINNFTVQFYLANVPVSFIPTLVAIPYGAMRKSILYQAQTLLCNANLIQAVKRLKESGRATVQVLESSSEWAETCRRTPACAGSNMPLQVLL